MTYVAGIDFGATNVRAAVAGADGTVCGSHTEETPRGPSGTAVTEAVLAVLRAACDDAGIAPDRLRAVGIGSIGPLDLGAGAVDHPANLPDEAAWIPLVDPVAELAATDRVSLCNDATAGVIGERFYGDRTPDDVVYLTISSGIGAGVVVDGHVLSGWEGNAGEVGHTVVDPRGRLTCGCGVDGHWEAYCSGENIPRYARLLADDADGDTALPLGESAFSAADVFAFAGEDALADRVVDRVADWNAIGVANLVHAYAPEVVRVGGAVARNNAGLVVEPVRERFDELVMTTVPDVELSVLGAEAVVRGAIASALAEGTDDRR